MTATLLGQARELAERLELTINECFPGTAVPIRAQEHSTNGRIRISPVDGADPLSDVPLPLYGNGKLLASWSFVMFAESSSDGFLKVDQLRLALTPAFDNTPVARLEFENRSAAPPVSHWQFHAERGSLSFILARTRTRGKDADIPRSLASLHFPTGGRHFRPGIEDFVQFLIQECGFDANDGWRRAIEEGRELARRFQVRTIARDYAAEVAEVLKDAGWGITPPVGFDNFEAVAKLREF